MKHPNLIRAVAGNSLIGANAQMIEASPKMEAVLSFSVGLDEIDLVRMLGADCCKGTLLISTRICTASSSW